MKRITVHHLMDETMAVDRIETEGPVNCKIMTSGGYVKVPGREVLYDRVFRIEIEDVTT